VSDDTTRKTDPIELEITVNDRRTADAEKPAPSRPKRTRKASAPKAAAPEAAAPEAGVDVAVRSPAAAPEAGIDVAVRSPAAAPAARPVHYWDGQPGDELYDVEVEVRNRAANGTGQAADMGRIAAGLLQLVGDNLRRMTNEQSARVQEMLRGIDLKDYLDPDFWKGLGMVLQYQVDEQRAFFTRRLRGEYSTDPYGMDRELIEVVRPFIAFMYRTWWRVEAAGLEYVPAEGRALLVANHSGVLPWDGAMIAAAIAEEHPSGEVRIVRSLHLDWFSTLPFISPALAALGQVPGVPENAVRLLESDELVCVFPEGLKGVGKLYKDRYKLARFGRGGFVQAALRTGTPLIPVSVVGAEEIYPMFANAEPIAKLLGFPYFPLTPFFPWFGLFGVIPLPTKWSITFGEPISTAEYGPEAANDPLTVLMLSEQVRTTIQETLDAKVAARTSIF
jgi:1-acyl-sn-glycerol-3-phosphate acyltransferase